MLPVAQFLSNQMRAETKRTLEDEELLWAEGRNRPKTVPRTEAVAPERPARRTSPWPVTGSGRV